MYLNPFAANLEMIRSQPSDQGSTIKDLSAGPSDGSTGVPSGGSTSTQGQSNNSRPVANGTPQTGSTEALQSGLLSGIQSGINTVTPELDTLKSNFYTAAGPERTYDSYASAAVNTLSDPVQSTQYKVPWIEPGPGVATTTSAGQSAYDTAKAALGAKYSGPAGYDATGLGQAKTDLASLGSKVSTAKDESYLSQPSGVGSVSPDLTPGERRLAAGRLQNDSGFQSQVGQYDRQYQDLLSRSTSEPTAAETYAKNRTTSEADIYNKTKDNLTSAGDTLKKYVEDYRQKRDAWLAAGRPGNPTQAQPTASRTRSPNQPATDYGYPETTPEVEQAKLAYNQIMGLLGQAASLQAEDPIAAADKLAEANRLGTLAGGTQPRAPEELGTDYISPIASTLGKVNLTANTGALRNLTRDQYSALRKKQLELMNGSAGSVLRTRS